MKIKKEMADFLNREHGFSHNIIHGRAVNPGNLPIRPG